MGALSESGDWSGRIFGEYEVERLVGQGGNGQVYLARHRWLQLPVAVKVLQHVNARDERTLERFRREARIAARLRHPNLVRCTDGGVIGDKLFLVTDFVEGQDLRQLVLARGPLAVADACEIMRQAAATFQFVVEKDTIHRDVKPANIMLDGDGVIRILDMGLARSSITGETLTETGQVMGTVDYMAPEQATDSRHVDFRADVYSLGCTFYYLLTGRAPFATDEHETLASKLLAHLESEPEPIRHARRDVPRAVLELIDRMLAKTADQRPQSFNEIRGIVERYAASHDLPKLVSTTAAHTPTIRVGCNETALLTRIGDGLQTVTNSTLRLAFVGMGFLDRNPTRPGQRASYRFSFRWLKAVMAIAALIFAFWFTGIRFGSSDSSFQSLDSGPASNPSTGVRYNEFH